MRRHYCRSLRGKMAFRVVTRTTHLFPSPRLHLAARGFLFCYNSLMTDQLTEAIQIIRELPEDEQDTIARQLMRLIELAQSSSTELASASGAGLS
jgi:hypothetical protein